MKLESFISVLKEFFLEILGFLIPGYLFLLIFIGYGTINYDFLPDLILFFKDKPEANLLFAYILGYIIYPMHKLGDQFREWLLSIIKKSKIENTNKILTFLENIFSSIVESTIETLINNSIHLKITRNKLNSVIGEDFSGLTYRDIRNLVMSYIPDESPKIYTFMFRADLCKSISSVVFWTIIPIVIYHCYYISSWKYLFLIPIIILFCYLLQITRYRFLGIAYRISFSMFNAKSHPLES